MPVYRIYAVSATVSGLLPGQTLVMDNNGHDILTFTANGSSTFATSQLETNPFNVTVLNATAGLQCTVTGGNGNMPAANVSAISISSVSATTPTPTSTAHPIPTLDQWVMLLLTGLLVASAGLFAHPRLKTISSSI